MDTIYHLWRKFKKLNLGVRIGIFGIIISTFFGIAGFFYPDLRRSLGIEKIVNGGKVKLKSKNDIDSSGVIILMDYLYVYPEKIGEFSDEPNSVINGINGQKKYGYNDWRLPTIQELELICANTSQIKNISMRGRYMSSEITDDLHRKSLDMRRCQKYDYFSSYYSEKAHVVLVRINNQAINTSATIEDIWIDHNINKNEQTGMNIQVLFKVKGMLNKTGLVAAKFYFSDGTALRDFNGINKSTDGNVTVEEKFRPGFENTSYDDFLLFIPYDELHLESGLQDLKFNIEIFDNELNLISCSDWEYFTLTVN